MSTRPLAFKPSFARQAGATMVATIITTGLWGVAICMVVHYLWRRSRREALWIKALVAALGILATLETIFANHQMYDTFITKKDNPAGQDQIVFSMPGKTACIFLTAFLAQLFYAARIWKLGGLIQSRFRFMAVPIVALALLQLGGGLIQVVIMGITKAHTVMWGWVWYNLRSMYINGAACAACDVLITIALVAILRSSQTRVTGKDKSILETLVIFSINRGIVISVFALLSILLYDFASGTLYYLIPFSSITHVYVISVVSVLFAAEGLQGDDEDTKTPSSFMNNSRLQKNETAHSSGDDLADTKEDPRDGSSNC